jgi:hypothetical protein
MLMKIEYKPESNSFDIEVNGQKESISYDELLNQMPKQIVRDRYLINEAMKIRQRIMDQVGDFNFRSADLVLKIAQYRTKMEEHIEEPKILKGYQSLIKSVESEKNTARELRLGIRLLEGQEARFMAELAKLEAESHS